MAVVVAVVVVVVASAEFLVRQSVSFPFVHSSASIELTTSTPRVYYEVFSSLVVEAELKQVSIIRL